MSYRYLEIEEVCNLHTEQIELWGGQHGVRDPGLVASALARPRHKADYEGGDIHQQSAALMSGLAKNHGFIDGNKRIAVVATDVFMQLNGWELVCTNEQLADFMEQCSDPSWTEEAVESFIRTFSARI